MNILAIDTSGPVCSVAVFSGDALRYEARAINKLTHSRSLMPMVDEAMHKAGVSKEQLTHLACVVGPGSFTGVRIGVAACQGMARGLGINCIAVNALEAMAFSACQPDAVICPLRDARSGQVYGAAFLDKERLLPDIAVKLDEFIKTVRERGERFFFLGDGAAVHGEEIIKEMGHRAVIAPAHLIQPGASAAAVLASQRIGEAKEPGRLMPLYLRAPQAERLLAQKSENA